MVEYTDLTALNVNDSILNTDVISQNETLNQSIFQIKDITDVQNLFSIFQNLVSDMLISWNMIPEDVYFRLMFVLILVLGIYQLFVSGSSKIGGLFKWVLMSVLVIAILIALNLL